MIIRTLQQTDLDALLTFELDNRCWFEQHLDPRPPDFYSAHGVAAHIADYLDQYQHGLLHPCLLFDEHGTILGRANLKHIDMTAGAAEVGYRIGQPHIGQGLASAALAHLKHLAQTQWQLHTLFARVTLNNHASARVLGKNQFSTRDWIPHLTVVAGEAVDGYLYQCLLPAPAQNNETATYISEPSCPPCQF